MQKETKCKNEVFSVFLFSLPQTKSSRRTQRCCRGGGMQIGPLPRRLHFISRKKKHSSFFLFSCFLLLLLDAGLQKNAAERQHKKSGNIFFIFQAFYYSTMKTVVPDLPTGKSPPPIIRHLKSKNKYLQSPVSVLLH